MLGYLLSLSLNRSLNNICAYIKSFSSPFVAFLSSPRPSPTLQYSLPDSPFLCLSSPLTCSRWTEGRSALEQLYFLLICFFPSQQRGKYMPAQLASCFIALEKVHCQSSTAIPPAFTARQSSQAGALRGPFLHVASCVSALSSQIGLGRASEQKKQGGRLTDRVKKGVNEEQNTLPILRRSKLRAAAYHSPVLENALEE